MLTVDYVLDAARDQSEQQFNIAKSFMFAYRQPGYLGSSCVPVVSSCSCCCIMNKRHNTSQKAE